LPGLKVGKIDRSFFSRFIYPNLGASNPNVIVGPRYGVDNAVLRVSPDTVMVVTTDPLSIIPSLGMRDSARITSHLLASDVATSGFRPQFAVLDFNLPPQIDEEEFKSYWIHLHRELKKLGVAIVGGHTGVYEGCGFTVVGGGCMMALGPSDKYLVSKMASPGDLLLMTKSAAVAATGILARSFPQKTTLEFGRQFLTSAQEFLARFSIVEDALEAAAVGVREEGVKAMHDVTEGGVLGGIREMAVASNVGVSVDTGAIPISPETQQLCRLFKIDPLHTLGEGALLIAVEPTVAEKVISRLRSRDILCTAIGRFTPKNQGMVDSKSECKLAACGSDPYWKAYWQAVKNGWK
jgi:hydrogenase maturation factor